MQNLKIISKSYQTNTPWAQLEPWSPGRQWEIIMLDVYAAGLTDDVQRLCWGRGYIDITHGGGASRVAQTNDTDHHAHVRKRSIELQTETMIRKSRRGMIDLTPMRNIDQTQFHLNEACCAATNSMALTGGFAL